MSAEVTAEVTAKQIVGDWAKDAIRFIVATDELQIHMFTFYPNARSFLDKKEEIKTFILEGAFGEKEQILFQINVTVNRLFSLLGNQCFFFF